MGAALTLARLLAEPSRAEALDAAGWTAVLAVARAEQLLGSLAWRLEGLVLPERVAAILADARVVAAHARRTALWEAEMARRALAPLGVPVVLLKGTAYAAAGLAAGQGRAIGDLDLLVPHEALAAVEAALLGAGWDWVKADAYDDAYYRRWMHELPPLVHAERDRMADVHHTILPPTARPTPDAAALIADAVPLGNGLSVLAPADMVVNAAAHLFADGDLAGGLRNLWDIDRLYRDFGDGGNFLVQVVERAHHHELGLAVARALRLAHALFALPVDGVDLRLSPADRFFIRRLLARDGWGREARPEMRLAFYVRSHLLRMPPAMLARHLWTKWRKPH